MINDTMDRLRAQQKYLVEQYQAGVGTHTLGKEMKCGSASVYRFLKYECKIKMREAVKIDDMREDFIRLYNEGKKIGEIAEELGIDRSSASKYRKKIGLAPKKKIQNDDINDHRETILSMYKEGLGCTRIARQIGFAETSVTRFLKNNNVDIRGIQAIVSTKIEDHADFIIEQYQSGVSTVRLGKMFGCSNAAIYIFLRDKCGIEMKEINYAENKKEEIIEKFLDGVSIMDISRELKIDDDPIRRLLKKYGYETKSIRINFEREFGAEIEELYHRGWGCTQLSNKFNTSESHVSDILNRRGVQTGKYQIKHTFNENYLDKIDTREKAYYIGYFTGDGCNTQTTASIVSIDRHILVELRKLFGGSMPIYTREKQEPHHYTPYMLSLCSTHLCNKLTEYGCPPNKTFVTRLPKLDNKDLYRGFFAGLIDSDGCITHHKNNWWLAIAGSKDLLFQAKDWIESNFDIKVGVYPDNNIYDLRIGSNKSLYTFLSWLYQDATIYMNRKYAKYLQFCKENNYEPVKTSKLNR